MFLASAFAVFASVATAGDGFVSIFNGKDLTGWKSPAAGGPTSKQLTPVQKAIDREARLTISRELAHE